MRLNVNGIDNTDHAHGQYSVKRAFDHEFCLSWLKIRIWGTAEFW